MPLFQKRPVTVRAVRFDPLSEHKLFLPEGVKGAHSPNADNWAYEGCKFYVETLEGRLEVHAGDWIIRGVKGEFYPCKDEIFHLTYKRKPCVSEGEVCARSGRKPDAFCEACR